MQFLPASGEYTAQGVVVSYPRMGVVSPVLGVGLCLLAHKMIEIA